MNRPSSALCSYYGRESVREEFKEFCLRNWSNFFTEEEVRNMFHDETYLINQLQFNYMIKHSLHHYLDRYLPKYIAILASANENATDQSFCKLHFGISDEGIIEGIPLFLTDDIVFEQSFFNEYIHHCFANRIRIKHNDNSPAPMTIDDIKQLVHIEIEKLDADNIDCDNTHIDRLNHYLGLNNALKAEWDRYETQYRQWFNDITAYNIKLKDLVNNRTVRNELIKFISNCNAGSECDTVIEFLESDETIDYEITVQTISDIGENKQHPIYWTLIYKDYKIAEIRKYKPVAPFHKLSDFNYYAFAQHMYNIRPYLLGQGCAFYKITINIPSLSGGLLLEYLDNNNVWQSKKRIIRGSEPITVDRV
jgi:hypothetical protein